jgi:hypothetical protein
VVEKVRLEATRLSEKGKVFSRECKRLEKVNHFLPTRGHQESTIRWELTHEQAEGGGREHAVLEVTRRHRQLVEVGKQGKIVL